MTQRYYLDTSIWLDFFENRDEPNLPKGKFAEKLISSIISEDKRIIYSDAVKDELLDIGYNYNEIEELFMPLIKVLIFLESTKKQFGKAKDISAKRDIPLFDALHALMARDSKSVMITRDAHFKKLKDVIGHKKPEDII